MIQWWWALIALVVGALAGVLLWRKFGSAAGGTGDLALAMLGFLFNSADIAALAKLAWDSGAIPDSIKTARYDGDVGKFVEHVQSLVSGLLPTITTLANGISNREESVGGGLLVLEGSGSFVLE